jgi:hypothetical protein
VSAIVLVGDGEVITATLDALYEALGGMTIGRAEDEDHYTEPPQGLVERVAYHALNRAIDKIQNRWCELDWRGYLAYAVHFRDKYAVALEPCHKWFDFDRPEPWIDEDEPPPPLSDE